MILVIPLLTREHIVNFDFTLIDLEFQPGNLQSYGAHDGWIACVLTTGPKYLTWSLLRKYLLVYLNGILISKHFPTRLAPIRSLIF